MAELYLNEFICGDSFLLLPEMEDRSVDLILTDPPYDFADNVKWWLHVEFMRISNGGVIVFSPPDRPWILPADQYGFWIKPISTKNTSRRYSRFVEMLFFYGNGTWNNDRHWSQYTNVFMDLVDDASLHPCRKPPSLIERLILNHTNENDVIFDPFAGSGVVLHTAKQLKRNFVGIEILPELVQRFSPGLNEDTAFRGHIQQK